MHFGNILKDIFENTGHTVPTLAKKAGVTGRSLRYYLRGERSPSLEIADKILKAAGVELTIGGAIDAEDKISRQDGCESTESRGLSEGHKKTND